MPMPERDRFGIVMLPPQPVNKALQSETALPPMISRAFWTLLLLTADVDRAERVVTQAIECWNPATESDAALFRRAIHNAAVSTGDGALAINQSSVAESLLPIKLRRVVRLPSRVRECYVLRVLIELSVQTVSYLLNIEDDEVRRFTCMGLRQIAADTNRRTVSIATARAERSSCVPIDQVFVKFTYIREG